MKHLITLILLSGLCFGQSYYVSYEDSTCNALQKQINDSLTVHVKGYNASDYTTVQYDTTSQRYFIEIGEDSREPLKYLSEFQKTFFIDRKEAVKQRLVREYEYN